MYRLAGARARSDSGRGGRGGRRGRGRVRARLADGCQGERNTGRQTPAKWPAKGVRTGTAHCATPCHVVRGSLVLVLDGGHAWPRAGSGVAAMVDERKLPVWRTVSAMDAHRAHEPNRSVSNTLPAREHQRASSVRRLCAAGTGRRLCGGSRDKAGLGEDTKRTADAYKRARQAMGNGEALTS